MSRYAMDEDHSNKLAVDREWISKLLRKHSHNGGENAHDGIDDPTRSRDASVAWTLAPMVDQSDLPFRLLCRRNRFTLKNIPPSDRPLIAQICGSDPETVWQCVQELQEYCDGIDINCGCPQMIAKRGNYGAFLLEQEEELLTMVRYLLKRLKIPLSVKVRLLPEECSEKSDIERSLRLYGKLVDAGIHMLTVHGRNRFQKGPFTGQADWHAIRQVVDCFGDRIPILANGSVSTREEALECLKVTNCDGVMCAEALLEYPPLFSNLPRVGRLQLAREYMELAHQYPPHHGGQGKYLKCVRAHIHRFLHPDMQDSLEVRRRIVFDNSVERIQETLEMVAALHEKHGHVVADEQLCWYLRHRTLIRNSSGLLVNTALYRRESESTPPTIELDDDAGECFACLFDTAEVA